MEMAMRTKRCGAMIKAMNLVAVECQQPTRLGKAAKKVSVDVFENDNRFR